LDIPQGNACALHLSIIALPTKAILWNVLDKPCILAKGGTRFGAIAALPAASWQQRVNRVSSGFREAADQFLTTYFSLGIFERLQCEEVRPPKHQALNGGFGREVCMRSAMTKGRYLILFRSVRCN
jgi:hypothetical protein